MKHPKTYRFQLSEHVDFESAKYSIDHISKSEKEILLLDELKFFHIVKALAYIPYTNIERHNYFVFVSPYAKINHGKKYGRVHYTKMVTV